MSEAAETCPNSGCANCHRAPKLNEKFSACTKCVQQKLKPAVYCSKECQMEDWPAHKQWHKGIAEMLQTQAIRSNSGDDGPERQAARHEEYSTLVKKGLSECAAGNRRMGAKLFEQCIGLRPEQPVAYANLGYTLRDDGDFFAALPALLKAVELFEEGSEQWATTAAVAWFAYSADSILCDEIPTLPAWLRDLDTRVALAERCTACAPSSMQCWAMLGMGLAEQESDLGRAAQCLMKAAKLTDQEATKKGYLDFARALLVRMKEQKSAAE